MTKTARFSTFGLAIALLPQLSAQTPQSPAPSSSVFRSGISYVELDASVLDRNRTPVRGLSAADFTALEDGQPQKVLTFTEINVPDPEPPPVAWMRDVTPDVHANDGYENRRLVIILLDNALISIGGPQWDRVKEIGRLLVDQLSPADLTAVLFSRIQRDSQDFTSDHARLRAAIDSYVPGAQRNEPAFMGMGEPSGRSMPDHFKRNSVLQLEKIAKYLIALPGRRKALFWVSPGAVCFSDSCDAYSFEHSFEIIRRRGQARRPERSCG